jgi:hypothetical protein
VKSARVVGVVDLAAEAAEAAADMEAVVAEAEAVEAADAIVTDLLSQGWRICKSPRLAAGVFLLRGLIAGNFVK